MSQIGLTYKTLDEGRVAELRNAAFVGTERKRDGASAFGEINRSRDVQRRLVHRYAEQLCDTGGATVTPMIADDSIATGSRAVVPYHCHMDLTSGGFTQAINKYEVACAFNVDANLRHRSTCRHSSVRSRLRLVRNR